ncbi:MAG: hypothetical protein VKM98_06675 [Cyanobacteriota bacterium]|nr:hypothetical protein [Cyanobacteriota bacterium]
MAISASSENGSQTALRTVTANLLSISTRQGQFWEVNLNGPELAGEPDLGRFAVVQELGPADSLALTPAMLLPNSPSL